jgi:hypothetical protein
MGKDAPQQIDLFARFRPTPSQYKFFKSPAFGRLFSSGYGSGKSKTGCREGIRWAAMHAGSRGLIGRLTATDLRDTTMTTFWKEMALVGFVRAETEKELLSGAGHYLHNKSDREIRFWNGSVILYRHLDDPDALGSLELNWAFIDEGAEVDDMIYKTISSSRLRWHLPGCDQQERVAELIATYATDEEIRDVPCDCPRGIWVCTNPGASGYLRSVTRGQVDGWEWIPARPGDNPYNGPDYYAKMERDAKINGAVWMRRFYEGSWDAFEGQRFPMFDRDLHVMQAPWTPREQPPDWVVVEGWDFGHRETFVCWMAYNPTSREPVVVFDEVQANEVHDPREVAERVHAVRQRHGIREPNSFGDPTVTNATTFSSLTPQLAYAKHDIHIAPMRAGKNPQARADLLTHFLNERRVQPDMSVWPGIVFGPNCVNLIESVINLRWKPQTSKAGEDPREVFLKKDDHGFDALGYGLCAVPPPGAVREEAPLSGVNLPSSAARMTRGREEWVVLD